MLCFDFVLDEWRPTNNGTARAGPVCCCCSCLHSWPRSMGPFDTVRLFLPFLKGWFAHFSWTHGGLLQYLDLLISPTVIPPEVYANKVLPPLEDLAEKYGIGAPICMQIIRPVLHSKLVVRHISTLSTKLCFESILCRKRRWNWMPKSGLLTKRPKSD